MSRKRFFSLLLSILLLLTLVISFTFTTAAGSTPPTATTLPASAVMDTQAMLKPDLTSLVPGITYYFRAKADGNGDPVHGEEKRFTTTDRTAPVISMVNSSNTTVSGATITWSTNEPATSQVEYGLTEEYGSFTALDSNAVNSHSVDLTDLKAGKTYHYRVISEDAANNKAASADETFATAARSRAMPTWAWALIGLAAVGVVGAAVYFISTRLAQ
jgi:phosphodiesterase/alkaline phosphatase D-like protein